MIGSVKATTTLTNTATVWLDFPDNWFLTISIIGLILLGVFILCLSHRGKREKQDILSLGPIPKSDEKLMYQEQENELRFIKNHQWNITYYIALIFSAVFAISQTVCLEWSIKIIFYIIVCLTLDYGVYLLLQIQYNLRDTRISITRTTYYRKKFKCTEKYLKQKKKEKKVFRDLRFFLPILLTFLIGFLVNAMTLWDCLWIFFKDLAGKVIQ